jgi:hypothetical protein
VRSAPDIAVKDRQLSANGESSAMTSQTSLHSTDLWAVTSYFNPVRYRRRLLNFRIFRKHLQIPLVAVELAYGPEFELQAQDADILIQLRGTAVLWQKERLLNIALKALPSSCRKVAWLDCDIIFDLPGWVDGARSLLDRFAVIQLFRQVHNLGPRWVPGKDCRSEVEFTQPSAASLLALGMPAVTCFGSRFDTRKGSYSLGLAWAARRELLERHLFYDAGIIGGGDRAMACAAHQCFERLMDIHLMNEHQRCRYISWAEPYYDSVQGKMGFLDADIFHLWHGDYTPRKVRARFEGLKGFEFSPQTDIAIDVNGSWRWNTDKHEMHEYVRRYFASRLEDGYPNQG